MDRKLHCELFDLCVQLELSIRVNSRNGDINIYEEVGHFECVEQALGFLRTQFKEALENKE